MINYKTPWYETITIPPAETCDKTIYSEDDFSNPKGIYQYLDNRVYGHPECKKKLSMFLWHLARAQTNNLKKGGRAILLLGNSGTGKTEFFRAISRIYSNLFIANGASMTPQGYKGETKLYSSLKKIDCSARNSPALLVIDEWDKAILSTDSWNRGEALQAEALKMMEGCVLNIGTDEKPDYVDTSNVNFVFMGAFSDLLQQKPSHSIGFFRKDVDSFSKHEISRQDLLNYGLTPEFLGRISDYIVLDDLTKQDFYQIINDSRYSPITKISKELDIHISVSEALKQQIVQTAFHSGEGVRSMYNQILGHTNHLLFEDCNVRSITIDAPQKEELPCN